MSFSSVFTDKRPVFRPLRFEAQKLLKNKQLLRNYGKLEIEPTVAKFSYKDKQTLNDFEAKISRNQGDSTQSKYSTGLCQDLIEIDRDRIDKKQRYL